MKISASVFAKKEDDFSSLVSELRRIGVSFLHIDCKNEDRIIALLRDNHQHISLPLDVHLISSEPQRFLTELGTLNVSRICLQYENLSEIPASFWSIKAQKGIALQSHTSLDVLAQFPNLDFVMLMCTRPGESGGKFDVSNFQRINELKQRFPKLKITIDGGVNSEVAFVLKLLSVDTVVSGSYLLDRNEYGLNMLNLLHPIAGNTFCVKDFLPPAKYEPILIRGKFTFREAVQSIEDFKTGYAIVVDEKGYLVGVITNADVRKALLKHWEDLSCLAEEEYINFRPIAIAETDSLQAMLNLIESQNRIVLFLPAIDTAGKFTGVVPLNNLAKG